MASLGRKLNRIIRCMQKSCALRYDSKRCIGDTWVAGSCIDREYKFLLIILISVLFGVYLRPLSVAICNRENVKCTPNTFTYATDDGEPCLLGRRIKN